MNFSKRNRNKIFCIGLNKTGTTTIEKTFKDFNYSLGVQRDGELLINDWYKRDFKAIIKLCKTAEAFQDVPFSLPFTYSVLDQCFPNAKFILSVRDNSDQWYSSLTNFHSKLWGNGIDPPTIQQLKEANYHYKGYAYEVNRMLFDTPEDDPYNKDILIRYYQNHNENVMEYFRAKPEKLLVINVSIKDDYKRLCEFLNKTPLHETFPWENKTS
ncbi:sulfotransferase [Psychroserpens luteus]|uniref:Sulfotransferase n=1 Tax=Psychroserpens luteus TaxID=1434066 RepID=A0ABW5ZUP1_9FLAO|nr:sulfotransferase [Psychroserpens luteus]